MSKSQRPQSATMTGKSRKNTVEAEVLIEEEDNYAEISGLQGKHQQEMLSLGTTIKYRMRSLSRFPRRVTSSSCVTTSSMIARRSLSITPPLIGINRLRASRFMKTLPQQQALTLYLIRRRYHNYTSIQCRYCLFFKVLENQGA